MLLKGFLEYSLGETSYASAWAIIILGLVVVWTLAWRQERKYAHIPSVGRTGLITSYIDAFRYYFHAHELVLEGYRKYKPGVFRIPQLLRWIIVVTSPEHIKEVHNLQEASFYEAISDKIGSKYRFAAVLRNNNYSTTLIGKRFTRILDQIFPLVHEEVTLACQDLIPSEDDWVKVEAYQTLLNVVGRVSNRVIVGPNLARDPEWIKLNVNFASQLILSWKFIGVLPPVLRKLADNLFTSVPESLRRGETFLKEVFEERRKSITMLGKDFPEQPLDYVTLLLEEASNYGEQDNDFVLSSRILGINLAAMHSTAGALTQTMFELIQRPDLIEPIRNEVETVINEHGWNKPALTHMRKLDSFLKEVTRLRHGDIVGAPHKAMSECSLSDGTKIPKGAHIVIATKARHHDESLYEDPSEFKGFRFSDIPEGELHRGKNVFAAANMDHLGFGSNKHICPGRHFGSMTLKTLMAHILLTYDFKMETVPKLYNFEEMTIHDPKAEVHFRRRRIQLQGHQ